jgi:hypothetical protein
VVGANSARFEDAEEEAQEHGHPVDQEREVPAIRVADLDGLPKQSQCQPLDADASAPGPSPPALCRTARRPRADAASAADGTSRCGPGRWHA